jgi:hypothetical protein
MEAAKAENPDEMWITVPPKGNYKEKKIIMGVSFFA